MSANQKYTDQMAARDNMRIKYAYVHLHDALNELEQVSYKDNIIIHIVRKLGAMEDTLYEYVMPNRQGRK